MHSEVDVIRLLKQACFNTRDKVYINYRVDNYIADAYTESGIKKLDIQPKTVIEIKNRLLPDTIYHVNKLQEHSPLNIQHVIVVLLEEDELVREHNEYIWTFQTLDTKWRKQKEPTTIDVDINELNVQEARKAFNKGRNALILGAGVSKNAGLPLWDELLKDIFYSIKPEDTIDNFDALSQPCGNSQIIKAQYLSELAKDSQQLSKAIAKRLRNYKHTIYKPLFESIANMIKTERIYEVLTFNYDDLLEDAIDFYLGETKRYFVVYSNNQELNDAMPIYHLHGFVPINKKREKIKPTPIISEKDYHQLYKSSFHWSNIALLHALNTNTCFFIGLSMLDPNMRRILDFYADEQLNGRNQSNAQHYVFLRKESLQNATLMQNESHWQIMEKMYERWKMKIIWFSEFHELPNTLDECSDGRSFAR